jgi:uncharacterized repeat protein (TIGR01451 family)
MSKIKILIPILLGLLAAIAVMGTSAQAKEELITPSNMAHTPNAIRDVCESGCTYSSIQAAIDDADPGDFIDIAAETFTETITVDVSVTIQGAGAGSTIIQAAGAPGIASSRVVTITEDVTATLDNLTIRFGNATGIGDDKNGAGIFNLGTLTLTNSTLYSNTAEYNGGGIYSHGYGRKVNLYINNCNVISNTALYGGAIFNHSDLSDGEAIATIINSRISNNQASSGGGINNNAWYGTSTITITNSSIEENMVSTNGGGLYNISTQVGAYASISIIQSTISGNSSPSSGAGIYNQGTNNGVAEIFASQSSTNYNSAKHGGGFYNAGTSSGVAYLSIADSTIYSNTATGTFSSGGGIYNAAVSSGEATVEISSSTISNNYGGTGGGAHNNGTGTVTTTLTISHSTFSDNRADYSAVAGGGIYNYNATLNLYGTILANSSSGKDCYTSPGLGTVVNLGHNLIELDHNCDIGSSVDPGLDPIGDNGGPTWTHALQSDSPALDAILPGECTAATDQRGVPRPQDSGCEIGSYEAITITEAWVDDDWHSQTEVNAYNPSLIWDINAFDNVGDAFEAVEGSTVHVLAGVYTENLTLDKNVSIIGESGAKNTIIQAAANPTLSTDRVFTVTAGVTVTLDGLTMRYGKASNGGGIQNMGTLTVTHCYLANNEATTNDGGAIYNDATSGSALLSIQQSTIAANAASRWGGGIANNGSSNPATVVVENSTFSGNSAQNGGGIANGGVSAALTVSSSTFSGNSASAATNGGGAIRIFNGAVTLSGSILANSTANYDCYYSNPITDGGHNLVEDGSCSFPLGGDPVLGVLANNGGSTFTHALLSGSPALDAIPPGSCTATVDQRDYSRPKGAGCDIGAYEAVTEVWVDDDWHGQSDVDAYDPSLVWGEDAFNAVAAGVDAVVGSTVHVLAGTYTERLTIDKSVEIIGEAGAENTIIQAAAAPGIAPSRVITIEAGITVTIDGLTIRYGNAGGSSFDGYGGGIYNQATFTLTNSIVVSNTAEYGGGVYHDSNHASLIFAVVKTSIIDNSVSEDGGGIYCDGDEGQAVLDISESTILDNSASQYGGGIYNLGNDGHVDVNITKSTISNNSASFGGGIFSDGGSGQAMVEIFQSTFVNNEAITGGGFYNYGESGVALADISQSTFSQNTATNGGGIYNNGNDGTGVVTTTHVTFWGNRATGTGGGVYLGDADFVSANTIIAGSTGGDCTQINSTITDSGYNLVQDGSCGFTAAGDPILGPLQANGGPGSGVGAGDPMLTHALLPGSPAIDAIPGGVCTADEDQRGTHRPFGPNCDIGAFELNSLSIAIDKSVDDLTPEVGQTITFTLVLSNPGPGVKSIQINDALPAGLNFVGLISVDGLTTGTVGDQPPLLATVGLTNSQHITVTFPVTVPFGLSANSEVVNIVQAIKWPESLLLASDSVTITIANTPPTAVDDGGPSTGTGFTTDEDLSFTTANVLTNDTDPNGDVLTILSINTTGTKGMVTNNADGTFSYDPNGQFEDLVEGESATDSFTYTVSDGAGGTDSATVTITITGMNDEPEGYFIYLPLILRQP